MLYIMYNSSTIKGTILLHNECFFSLNTLKYILLMILTYFHRSTYFNMSTYFHMSTYFPMSMISNAVELDLIVAEYFHSVELFLYFSKGFE